MTMMRMSLRCDLISTTVQECRLDASFLTRGVCARCACLLVSLSIGGAKYRRSGVELLKEQEAESQSSG